MSWTCRCGTTVEILTDDTVCGCKDIYEQEWMHGDARRLDTEGRDVTDLPGLWSEEDRFVEGGSSIDSGQSGARTTAPNAGNKGDSGNE